MDTETLNPSADKKDRKVQRQRRRLNRSLMPVVWIMAGTVVMNAGISLLLVQWRQPETVSFDMAGTVNSFMTQAATLSLDEAQIKALTARFNTALTESLTAYQRDRRTVIIVAPAVVGGAEDITPQIQQAVAERMAGGE